MRDEKVRELNLTDNDMPDGYYIYKADDYSEENPLYIIKGMDKNGNEYEQTVDVSKVNPNNCSYKDILEFRKEENFKHKEQNIELNKKALALRAYNQQILEEH